MKTIYVVALEPLDTRYTADWLYFIPQQLEEQIKKSNLENEIRVTQIYGSTVRLSESLNSTSAGAFLNFTETNIWKNYQANIIADLFGKGEIKQGDKFIFTDAWNTNILQLRYMSDLLGIPVEIHSIWHAGSYDPMDFLGRNVENKDWSFNAERAMFCASDVNYFATSYHTNLFKSVLNPGTSTKIVTTGFPFDYLKPAIREITTTIPKEDIILFPHRISVEKDSNMFRELESRLGHKYKFIMCQEKQLTKREYYELLGKSKLVFSANKQETLGISMYEALLADCNILVPNRLSYIEMYDDPFKYYPENFKTHKELVDHLVSRIDSIMTSSDRHSLQPINKKATELSETYFSGYELLDNIILS